MNSPGTMITIETAPRDPVALAKEGVFIHRRLSEALEAKGFAPWKNNAEKTAFITASPNDRAASLVQKLREFDASQGGTPAAAAPPPPPPLVPADPAPAQDPASAAAPAPTGRSPKTNANGVQTAGVVELLTAIKGLSEELKTIRATVEITSGAVASLANGIGSLNNDTQNLKGMLAASMKIQEVQLGLLCLFGQQVLNAPIEAFLESAIGDANAALNLLEQMGGSGKG